MPEKIFGLPAWEAIATLGAAGVVGYLIFIRGQGGGSSSGGSTYSAQGLAVMQNPDESATMALQNEELSQIATNMASSFSSLGTSVNSIAGQTDAITTQEGQNYAANQAYYTSLYNSLQSIFTSLQSQVSQASQTSTDIGSQNYGANNAYYMSLYNQLQQLLQQQQSQQPAQQPATSGAST